jgi:hypothetical protein
MVSLKPQIEQIRLINKAWNLWRELQADHSKQYIHQQIADIIEELDEKWKDTDMFEEKE